MERHLAPLLAQRFETSTFAADPAVHVLGPVHTCPVRARLGHRDDVAGPLWYLPVLEGDAWQTPVSRILSRLYELLDTTRYGFAHDIVEPAISRGWEGIDEGSDVTNAADRWYRKLARWDEPWSRGEPALLPQISDLRALSHIYGYAVGPGAQDAFAANAFRSFLRLEPDQKKAYVLSYYEKRASEAALFAREGLAYTEKNLDRVTASFERYAIEYGRLDRLTLYRSLLTARTLQAAYFGTREQPGLWQLADERWGPERADGELVSLFSSYERRANAGYTTGGRVET